jgi:hypothetical protein
VKVTVSVAPALHVTDVLAPPGQEPVPMSLPLTMPPVPAVAVIVGSPALAVDATGTDRR